MNTKIFIEYDNTLLQELSNKLKNIFQNNNYDVTILGNNLSISDKKKILNNYNNYFLLSNKLNNSNNSLEIIYPLKSNDTLAKSIFNYLENKTNITKYYQLRSNTITREDYYEILRYANNNSIIIKYGNSILNSSTLPKDIFESINNYLNDENIYIVKSGDSLYSIAKKFNTTVDELKRINNLTSNNLSINQKLTIPNNQNISENIYIVKSGDSLYSIAKKFNTTVDELKRINNLTSNNLSINQKLIIPNNQNTNENIYIVKSGDSLYSIAKSFNTTVDNIKRTNNLSNNLLSIGQKLIIK